jgi:signal transduction histidine kinase
MKPPLRTRVWNLLKGLAVVLALQVSTVTAAYYLTALAYARLGWHPPDLAAQIINGLLGLGIAFLVVGGVVRLAQARGWSPQGRGMEALLTAMQQIAKGDFNVRVDNPFGDQPFGELVNSINTMAVELGQMEQLRQEFISDVSHEIQSPLTSIHGFALALQQNDLSPEQHAQYLDIILSESTRLGRLTDHLLRLAALQADHARFQPRSYRLDKQIRALILACEPQWTAKQLDLDVCLEPVSITADDDLLSQVWINLLSNAIKFTPAGGRVRVELAPQGADLAFRIADTGIGIALADQGRLFERFYKADRARTAPTGGSGLGLAIAKKIVEMHHGTIAVESAPGAGATFQVVLPLESQAADPPAPSHQLAPPRPA